MSGVVLDTHTVIWYVLKSTRLSAAGLAALERASDAAEPVYLASISLVETRYLIERGRVPEDVLNRLERALTGSDAVLTLASLDLEVAQAMAQIPRSLVPEMPDRIIAATSLHLNAPLITRDRLLRAAPITTIW